MEPTSSSSSWSSRNVESQCPFFAQLEKRLYTDFHGPNRSGRSRQGQPVLARQSTASMNSLSPKNGVGPVICRGKTA